uniref:RNA polymerase beta subunit n=1 Tax=Choristocarpus tenellus TaxID=116065 RepID=UPI002E77693F|nr:RNA polymerase beta subunit [Choristocarpus tenellus]WAM62349.1 RNA polymerase beta subunit [Choristocarpus tenellus]
MKNKFPINIPHLSKIQQKKFLLVFEYWCNARNKNYSLLINSNNNIEIRIYGHKFKFDIKKEKKQIKEIKNSNLIKLYIIVGIRQHIIEENGPILLNLYKKKQKVLLCEIPLITHKGTFIYNGCERVVMNQLVRSPGVYFKRIIKEKKITYDATIITNYGSWLTFEIEYNLIWVKFDKKYKIPINWFLLACELKQNEILNTIKYSVFLEYSIDSLNYAIYKRINEQNQDPKKTRIAISLNVFRIKELINNRLRNNSSYDLGEIGRIKINKKLDINIPLSRKTLTHIDILKTIDYLIEVCLYKKQPDDIDNLENRRVRSVGELLQVQLRIGLGRLKKYITNFENVRIKKTRKNSKKKLIDSKNNTLNLIEKDEKDIKASYFINAKILTGVMREFFGLSPLSQYFDETNALSQLTHKRRISSLGPGALNSEHVSFSARDIHPTQYGRLCPIETPEGQKAGLVSSLAIHAKLNKYGFIVTPFYRVYKGEVLKSIKPIYLTAEKENQSKVASADIKLINNKYLSTALIPVRFHQEFILVNRYQVDYIAISPIQIISAGAALIPFLEHDDANRALMGSNMQRQAVPLLYPQKPIIGTGLEFQIANDSRIGVINLSYGIVESVFVNRIYINLNLKNKNSLNKHLKIYYLEKYRRSNQEIGNNQKPIVWPGQIVKTGQIIADGPGTDGGELALGQNLNVAYMPWEGYNYEDAILISERLIHQDLFTSIHIERFQLTVNKTSEGDDELTDLLPPLDPHTIRHLDKNGYTYVGAPVKGGDVLIGKRTPKSKASESPESRLLKAVFNLTGPDFDDTSLRLPKGISGRVLDIQTFSKNEGYKLQPGVNLIIHVYIAEIKKIKIGDKISGRHGNKGVISKILPLQDMPFLPDGTIIDVILNPLGVPSRMNVGQIFECLLGLAGDNLNCRFKVLPFDEMYKPEASRILINKKLKEAAIKRNKLWLFNSSSPGKVSLVDGRNGETFDNPVLVGKPYILKLVHLIDHKMHARASGPYSLVTQQPLGGKSRGGGQRFGEMEVWALEAFGVAYTLQELLTIKSDDMDGRMEMYNSMIQNQDIPKPGIPESFRVLCRELNALGLDITTYRIDKLESGEIISNEINLFEIEKMPVFI